MFCFVGPVHRIGDFAGREDYPTDNTCDARNAITQNELHPTSLKLTAGVATPDAEIAEATNRSKRLCHAQPLCI